MWAQSGRNRFRRTARLILDPISMATQLLGLNIWFCFGLWWPLIIGSSKSVASSLKRSVFIWWQGLSTLFPFWTLFLLFFHFSSQGGKLLLPEDVCFPGCYGDEEQMTKQAWEGEDWTKRPKVALCSNLRLSSNVYPGLSHLNPRDWHSTQFFIFNFLPQVLH